MAMFLDPRDPRHFVACTAQGGVFGYHFLWLVQSATFRGAEECLVGLSSQFGLSPALLARSPVPFLGTLATGNQG